MNAIEQMMQAFGANSAQSMAAIFGTSAAAESNAAEFASQFNIALQNSEGAIFGSQSPWRLAKSGQVGVFDTATGVTGANGLAAEFSGQLQTHVVEPASASADAQLKPFLTEDGTPITVADLTEADLENGFLPYAEGIPGLQLVQLTGVQLTDLVESGQLQPLSANQQLNANENDLFLFAVNGSGVDGSQPVRLLPIAQLEAVNTPAGTVAAMAGQNTADTGEQMQAALAGSQTAAQNVSQAQASTQQTVANSPAAVTGAQDSLAAAEQSKTMGPGLTAAAGKTADELATQKAAEQAVSAKADNKAAEGHAVQQNQKAEEQAAKTAQRRTAFQSAQQQGDSTAANAAAAQSPAATTAGKAAAPARTADTSKVSAPSSSTAKDPMEPVVANNNSHPQQPAAQRASTPITWTPERLVGLSDGSATSEAMAGGLSGLRGEQSFMSSMGLMGGKPSAALGGHVAKQVNLQISKAVKNGAQEFNMRLNPGELGSIKVKMTFAENGRVSAQVLVERPETLELLQREVRGMERALEAGGNKLAEGGISFNLDTGDGQSAGKSFAEAVLEDKHQAKMENGASDDEGFVVDPENENNLTDLAELEKILSRVSPDTGLDVRV